MTLSESNAVLSDQKSISPIATEVGMQVGDSSFVLFEISFQVFSAVVAWLLDLQLLSTNAVAQNCWIVSCP